MPYSQLMGSSAIQPAGGQSQLCYQYDGTMAQPALAASPVQQAAEPLLAAAQSSQIIGQSQVVQQRFVVVVEFISPGREPLRD